MRSLLVPLVLAGVLLTGCSGEEEVVDDGSQAAVVDEVGLAAADVEVLSPATPAAIDRGSVVAALEDDGLTVAGDVPDGLALEPDAVAGLLATLGDGETYVVLVFDEPASAAVFAAGDREVFSAADVEGDKQAFLAGSVLAYAGPGAPSSDVRGVLEQLGATTTR